MISKKRLFAVVGLLMIVMVPAAIAVSTSVSLVTVSGSRALAVKTMTGSDLNALALGSGREAPFLVNVSDLAYDRKGYTVSAMLSNLYKFDPVDGYDCEAASIPSSKLSIDFLANPNSVRDVKAAAEPVLNFAGTITNTALLTSLGLSSDVAVAASVTEQLQEFANSTIFSGLENALPIKISALEPLGFELAAPHADCQETVSSSTSIPIQRGNVNSHADLLAWVKSASDGVYSAAASDGVLSIAEAVSSGMVSQESVDTSVRTALTTLGVNPLLITSAALASVETLLSAPAANVSSILRQTGTYSSLPKIVVGDVSGTPTGIYKGTMTITLIDDSL